MKVMQRIQEDVVDCKRRVNDGASDMNEDEWPCARLLDLRKAYPRVSKPALWSLLERYGTKGQCLEALLDLHETTEYRVKGREGLREGWMPARGLQEGCPTSPILFSIYHQAVMRQALEARGADGREEKSVVWKWMPGSSFASERVRERGSGEAKEIRIDCMLFADDMTVVGTEGEMDESVRRVKEVMGRWEERNNEDKEEVLEFGTEEGDEVRILGSWMGEREDVKNRIRRAGMLWGNVRGWLKGSRLSKRWQGRIVQACVCYCNFTGSCTYLYRIKSLYIIIYLSFKYLILYQIYLI